MVLIRTATSTDANPTGSTFRLRKILWSPAGAATFALKDGLGNVQVVLTPAAAGIVDVRFDPEGILMPSGSQLTTLTGGGTVQLYGS